MQLVVSNDFDNLQYWARIV